jgi:hypothetical protein
MIMDLFLCLILIQSYECIFITVKAIVFANPNGASLTWIISPHKILKSKF